MPLSAPPFIDIDEEAPLMPRGMGPLPGLEGGAIPPRPPVGDKGVPVGGDEEETEPAEPPLPIGVGEACGISSGRGMFLPRGTFACSALPDRESAQSPESEEHLHQYLPRHTLRSCYMLTKVLSLSLWIS
jgi:hypothetical protein